MVNRIIIIIISTNLRKYNKWINSKMGSNLRTATTTKIIIIIIIIRIIKIIIINFTLKNPIICKRIRIGNRKIAIIKISNDWLLQIY